MTSKNLLIVFVKNILLGKVKTRLAKTIGDVGAFEVYSHLVSITERETTRLKNCDVHIYFSDVIIDTKWNSFDKFVQSGEDLGERMHHAFTAGFTAGYQNVVGIGSDLPELTSGIIENAFTELEEVATVFGPASDGGYYLLGMSKLNDCIFENKRWSTDNLLDETLAELETKKLSYKLLEELNDIDTLEDLKKSSVSTNFKHLYELPPSNK